MTGRMGRANTWGADGVRQRTSGALWRRPLRWDKLAQEGRLPDGSENQDGHRPRVFCASLADAFEPRPELELWRHELFVLIERTPNLDWLLLTKRPEEAYMWLRKFDAAYDYLRDDPLALDLLNWGKPVTLHTRDDLGWGVLPNVWIGTSIENSRHTWRADVLRQIPAAVRFISAEPLLGSLYLGPSSGESPDAADALRHPDAGSIPVGSTQDRERPGIPGGVTVQPDAQRGESDPALGAHPAGKRSPLDLTGIDWLIVGGESGGRDARPMHPTWARELRDGALEQDVALHFKQWGSWEPTLDRPDTYVLPSGAQVSRIQADAYDVDMDGAALMHYAGASPKAGGKRLDGAEHCEFPDARVPA